MATIEWTYEDEDGNEHCKRIPALWEICSDCQGNGASSAYLGAFTQEDIERDWSQDEWSDYLDGGYDKPCGPCNGSGKVLVPDWEALEKADPALATAYGEDLRSEAEYQQLCRMERLMGC